VKRLIVNADDLGRSPGVNQGIAQAHAGGIVTSATLLVNYPAAAEVPTLAQENPGLGVGLHLALMGGRSTLPATQVPSLVTSRGLLPDTLEELAAAQPRDILAEARAQLRRFRELMGRDPTHFDAHHHAHKTPVVLEVIVTLAWETGLPVRSLSAQMRARFRAEGIVSPDHFVEAFHGDAATQESLVRILGELPRVTSELMCHPAIVDEELMAGSRYAEPRARELQALTSSEARQVLQAAGVRLIHYGALAA
jgi:predicted glycoside hydrolase/deacetylase ChbG (UPF0249 family)